MRWTASWDLLGRFLRQRSYGSVGRQGVITPLTLTQRQADTVCGMFGALGRLASRRPWFVIAAWIVFAVAVIALAPAFKATQDQAEFLPDHYESIKAYNLQDEAFGSTSQVAAIVVFDRKDGGQLTADDQAEVRAGRRRPQRRAEEGVHRHRGAAALRERTGPARRGRPVRRRDGLRHGVLRRGQGAARRPEEGGDRRPGVRRDRHRRPGLRPAGVGQQGTADRRRRDGAADPGAAGHHLPQRADLPDADADRGASSDPDRDRA